MTISAEIEALHKKAMDAESDWEAALKQAGVDRYSYESGKGEFADLYRAKVETYDAFRKAAFGC